MHSLILINYTVSFSLSFFFRMKVKEYEEIIARYKQEVRVLYSTDNMQNLHLQKNLVINVYLTSFRELNVM